MGLASSRAVVRLTLDHLDAFPAPCRSCLFWECDAVRRQRLDEPALEKQAWVSEVLREWGSCGRVLLVDGELAGYVLYAPAGFVPGAAALPTAPVSPDAVLLTTAWVAPECRGGGLGRLLVRGMARDLVDRDVRAVEAFGYVPGRARRQECTLPVDFLGAVGFRTQRAHPVHPRMRMDLRTALSWRHELEAALERLVGVVRPRTAPRRAPEGRRAVGGGAPPRRRGVR